MPEHFFFKMAPIIDMVTIIAIAITALTVIVAKNC